MAIKFRCSHCQQLMGISSRKSGLMVTCTACGEETLVPSEQSIEDDPSSDPEKELIKKEESSKAVSRENYTKQSDVKENHDKDKEYIKEASSPPGQPPSNPWDEEISDDEGGFSIRKAETEFGDMDLTPMVDVTFLLLVFFMITASFSLQKTIQIPAPDPDQEGAAQSQTMLEELLDESIQVDINEENLIFIDDEPLSDINDLASRLSDKMIEDGKSELVLTAHAVSLHENVIRVIDAAKEVGMQKIRLATTSLDDE